MSQLMGYFAGMPIIENPYIGENVIKFTRKQTRKFTNTRWVKKYMKKYSYTTLIPGAAIVSGSLVIHPALLDKLKLDPRVKTLPEFGDNRF